MSDYGHRETDKMLSSLEKRIEREYERAYREVGAKLDEYLRKFKVKDEIKRKALKDGTITQQQYDYWRTGQIMIGHRWEEMRDTLAEDLTNANKIAASMMNEHLPEVYALNHNYGTFEIEKGSQINTSYTLYDRYTVERLIRDQPDLLPKARVDIPKDMRYNKEVLTSALTQGILQGKPVQDIAKDIFPEIRSKVSFAGLTQRQASALERKIKYTAIRNARTMTTSAENAGREDSYRRAIGMGIKMKQMWLATLDSRTRHSHRDMDGEVREVGEQFSNGCEYPGDPSGEPEEIYNCRCTLIAQVEGVDLDVTDTNIRNNKLATMTYNEWKNEHQTFEVNMPQEQLTIGTAKTVADINAYMMGKGWFRTVTKRSNLRYDRTQMKWAYDTVTSESQTDLTGCDLEGAKSIASAYQQVFDKYPQLKGKLDAPDAQPSGMKDSTYAWCYIRQNGKVEVNPHYYSDWDKLSRGYEHDVASNWHPKGTTAESIVTHELGHSIDGLLAREGIIGGYTASGEFRYASSSLKQTIMSRAAKVDEGVAADLELDRTMRKQFGITSTDAVANHVSRYATENAQEWFAECFAEYITSANPRTVARLFGEELERLLSKLK